MAEADRDGVLEAMVGYTSAIDDRDLERLRQVFDEATIYELPDKRVVGVEAAIAELLVRLAQRPVSRHLVCNVSVRVEGDRAVAMSDWYLMMPTPEKTWFAEKAGRYYDELRRAGERWVFDSRRIKDAL